MQPQSSRRRRGILLTPTGLKRLQQAIDDLEYRENYGEKYTLEALSERTRLDPVTIAKVLEAKDGVDKRTLERFFRAIPLELDSDDYIKPLPKGAEIQRAVVSPQPVVRIHSRYDLSEAIDVSIFHSRTDELTQLERWIVRDRCRLVAVLGMGGMGKTALAVKLVQELVGEGGKGKREREKNSADTHFPFPISHSPFEYVIWKSLRNALLIEDLLADLIQFLSDGQEAELANNVSDRMGQLLHYLRQHRCLLILDNVESILRSGSLTGYCCEGYEAYGELFNRIGETNHQSCLLLTSREQPRELALLEGKTLCVRSLQLRGLEVTEGRSILQVKGECVGTDAEWRTLVEHYAGNPLALTMVASVLQLFEQVNDFLKFLQCGSFVFEDIQDLFNQQFERLSKLEREVIYCLAINREGISLAELQDDFLSPMPECRLIEALISLERRSLIEKAKPTLSDQASISSKAIPMQLNRGVPLFMLQPVVMEYVTHHLIEQVCQEIQAEQLDWFNRHPLVKGTAKEHIQEAQIRLILQPVTHRLLNFFYTREDVEAQFTHLWEKTKTDSLAFNCLEKNMLDLLNQMPIESTGSEAYNSNPKTATKLCPAP